MNHNQQISLLTAAKQEADKLTQDQLEYLDVKILMEPINSMNFTQLRALQLVCNGMGLSALIKASVQRIDFITSEETV